MLRQKITINHCVLFSSSCIADETDSLSKMILLLAGPINQRRQRDHLNTLDSSVQSSCRQLTVAAPTRLSEGLIKVIDALIIDSQ